MLPDHTGTLGAAAAEIIADQVLDLVAVSFAKTMESGGPRVSSARSLALLKLCTAVEARLADLALDARRQWLLPPERISVRYANAALSQEGTSIARLIQARRSARCRGALVDPRKPTGLSAKSRMARDFPT